MFLQPLRDFTHSLCTCCTSLLITQTPNLNADLQGKSKHWVIEFSMGKFTALLFWLVALFAREHPGCSQYVGFFPPMLSRGFLGAISSILSAGAWPGSCTHISSFIPSFIKASLFG